jgi:periplasmic protein TonB
MRLMNRLASACLATAALALAGCTTTPAPSNQATPGSAAVPPSGPFINGPAQATAPRGQTMAQWKRQAAERIHQQSKQHTFDGKVPDIVHAVVVVQMTVAPDGKVLKSEVLRRPDYAGPEAALAVKSAYAASPLPPLPAAGGRGTIQVAETWLFRKDGRFQLRTLVE